MRAEFKFSFANLEAQYRAAQDAGYDFITCEEYFKNKESLGAKTIVNRVDIDLSVKKADRLHEIYDRLGIRASFFVRLHAPEYNPFSFENYRILKKIRDSGHEIGYHSEIVDQAAIWNEDPIECLRRDLDILSRMLKITIKGVASHGGMTGLNNLDFWKDRKASDFSLMYETYDTSSTFDLFDSAFYISDSEWTRWKCYDKGQLKVGDNRNLGEHILDSHELIYLLLHPETYFDQHIYE